MSQEKVDRYKKEKANRKQIMRKAKIQKMVSRCVIALVAVALVGGFGYSAYSSYQANIPKEEVTIDYSAIDELSQNLSELQLTDGE